jgi:uncharacterized protein (TIGR03545 family)/uncharacterized protein (TIGR03546 family)
MNGILKLFKALNSSGKSWQISGAVALAMVAGFLPTSSLLLLDVLFIALILNVNFGVFMIFTVIFSGIGYMFDPMFESIGYAVLTSEGLNAFFTFLYNSALFRWSAFNYTLVTGSLVVSLALVIPVMLILNKLITTYRVQIAQNLNKWKFTKWMNLFNEEEQKNSLFRLLGLGVFGGLALVISIIFIFVFDPLVRIGMEKGLSYSLKTEVTIKDFSSNFSDLKVEITGIQIADKDKLTHNLVQVQNINFDLGFSALLERKGFIQNLSINALAFDEKRASTASAYGSPSSSTTNASTKSSSDKQAKEKSSAISNPFAMPSVDDILAKEELNSVKEAKALKADIQTTKEKWAKVSAELKSANEVDEIKKDAAKLQESIKGGDFSKIASAKDDLEKIKSKITNLKSKYTKLKKEFNADQKRIQKSISSLKNLPAKDIARLKKKYSLDASGGANIIGTLIDDEVGGYIKIALKYYEMAKPYMSSSEDEVEEISPPRGQGRWIKYTNLSNTPNLVIANAKINVKLKNDTIDVLMKDFSTNQKMYKKSMTLHVDAKGSSYTSVVGDLEDNRIRDVSKTTFDVKMQKLTIAELDMKALSMNKISTNAIFKGVVEDGIIKANSDIAVKKVSLKMGSQELINELLAGISSFNVNIALDGDVKKPGVKVKSDLDKQLSKGLSGVAKKAAKGFEKKLTAGIMDKFGGSSSGISSNLGDLGSMLDSKQGSLDGIDVSSVTSSGGGAGSLIKKFF